MSGGSFNYLYCATDATDLLAKRSDLEDMADFLAARGYAKDAAKETAAILARLRQIDVWAEVAAARLAAVWRAAEYWQSADSSEADLLRAIADYRGVELPDCDHCGGTGTEPETDHHACARWGQGCARGKDVSGIREGATSSA